METLLKIHTFLLGFLAFSLLAIVIIFKAPPIFKDDSMPNIYPAPHLDIFYQDDKLHRIFLVKSKHFSVSTCNAIQKWITAYLSNYKTANRISFIRENDELTNNYYSNDNEVEMNLNLICEFDMIEKRCVVCNYTDRT